MEKPVHKLFLLDAMALIYRAHFAFIKAPRITSKGLNTSAVFGFTNTLLEVLQKEKPTHIGVAFDTAAPTFRHVQFEAYKAQREAQPEDITVAIPLVKRLLRGMCIPILEMDGYEADDIIGSLSRKLADEGYDVIIVTGDSDLLQLLEDHIIAVLPGTKRFGELREYDTAAVLDRAGEEQPRHRRDDGERHPQLLHRDEHAGRVFRRSQGA